MIFILFLMEESIVTSIFWNTSIIFLTRLSSLSLLLSLAEFKELPVEFEWPWAWELEGRVRGDTSGGCTLLRILEHRRRQWVSSPRPRACRWQVRAATMRKSSWGRCSVWISMYVSWKWWKTEVKWGFDGIIIENMKWDLEFYQTTTLHNVQCITVCLIRCYQIYTKI